MLALAQPDPALAFPGGTTLQPQLFIRNASSKSLTAALRFNWRGDSGTGKSQGPALQLLPYETRRIDVAALQDGKILPKDAHWTSVILTTNGRPDEAMAVAASYDATLQRGTQTPFSDQLAFAWEGGMWEYDAQHNSLMTVGNGGTKPTRAALALFYNQGAERYDLEQALQPDEQMWIDVGKLIREQVPDKNGKVLPAGLSSGSYEFRDLNDHLAGTLFEGKVIYEKTYGHVTYGCMNCCDYTTPHFTFNPLPIPFQGTAPNGVWATDCNGIDQDVSNSFDGSWTTGNTAIATVDFSGNHTGAGVGSTISYVYGPLMTQHGRICYNTDQHGTGGDNVAPKVTIDSFSPNPIVGGNTATVHITVTPSANITLTINKSGTGSATFGTSGNTSLQIQQTTAVTITGGSESNGGPDLALQAAYGSSPVIVKYPVGYPFSVTTGACTATYSGHRGEGPKVCPSQVQVSDLYSLKEYCSSCQFSCIPISYDSTFTPGTCSPNSVGGVQGAGNQNLTLVQEGNFTSTDCNYHTVQIQTTVTNAQGTKKASNGLSIGIKCTAYPNGSLCP